MNTKTALSKIYAQIIEGLGSINSNPSLMSGYPGVVLFLAYYAHFARESRDEILHQLEHLILDSKQHRPYESLRFSDGICGLLWSLNHLEKEFSIVVDLKEYQDQFNTWLIERKEEIIQSKNLDFLHGLLGMHLYFEQSASRFFGSEIDQLILDECQSSSSGCFWFECMGEREVINTSMAHGQAAIIVYLASRIKHQKEESRRVQFRSMIYQNIYFLDSIRLKNSIALYPSYLINDQTNNFSRLAWCYGDLSIATSFLYAGKILNDPKLIEKAIEIGKHSCKRRTQAETGIIDLGLCHGSAGIMQIYSYFFRASGQVEFQLAGEFWHKYTLERINKLTSTYKACRGDEGWVESLGLLDGLAGIGLALISYLDPNLSHWEELLYLKPIRDGKNQFNRKNGGEAHFAKPQIRSQ